MKILHPLLCYYPSQAGGPANTLYWLNNALDPNSFSCSITATQFGLVEAIDEKEYGPNHKALFLEGKGWTFIRQNLKELKSSDIVQFSSLFFPPTLPILLAAIWKKKAIIISPRGELYDAAVTQKALKKKIWIALIKRLQSKLHFHATNDFELSIINKTFPKAKDAVVIPNYIEMPYKYNLTTKNSFVFVGRINPIKNIHLLVAAMAEVQKSDPTVKLDLVGSARLDYELDYLKTLKDQITQLGLENVVTFRGHLEGEDKNKVIAASKALILPSKSENFGNVVLEALAQGTPVIASRNTPWQLLEDYEAGYWVDGNLDELVKSVKQLLSLDDSAYLRIRNNAFKLCQSKFDVQSNSEIWENYYKKITTYV